MGKASLQSTHRTYGLGAISGPAQFALAEPETVGAAIRSPQLPPKNVAMHPTEREATCWLLLALLLRERPHDRPADADPRRRFSPAGGAL